MANAQSVGNTSFPPRGSIALRDTSRLSSRASIVSTHNATISPTPHPTNKTDKKRKKSKFSQIIRKRLGKGTPKEKAPEVNVSEIKASAVKESIDASKPKRKLLDKLNYELLKRGIQPKTRAFTKFHTHEQNEEKAFIETLRVEFGAHAVLQAKAQLEQSTLFSQKARKAMLKETREIYYKNLLKNYKGYIGARATLDVLLDATDDIRQQFSLPDSSKDIISEIQELKRIINDSLSHGHHVDLCPDPEVLGLIRKQVGEKSVALKKAITDAVMQSPHCFADDILMPFETGSIMYDRIAHRRDNCAALASLSDNYRDMVKQHVETHKEVHDLAIQKQKAQIRYLMLIIAKSIVKWAKLSSENNKFKCIELFDFAVFMTLSADKSSINIEVNANGLEYPIRVFLQKINQAIWDINDPEFTRILIENLKSEDKCSLIGVNKQLLFLKETQFAKNNYVKTIHNIQHDINFVVKKGVLINLMSDFLRPYNERVEDGQKSYSFFKEPRAYLRQLSNFLFRANRDVYVIKTVSNYIERLAYANTRDEYLRLVEEIGKNHKLKKLRTLLNHKDMKE